MKTLTFLISCFALLLSPAFAFAEVVTTDNENPIELTTNTDYTVESETGPFTFSGVISDGGSGYSITKDGLGKLVFSGVNTYSGGTTVSGGTLQAGTSTSALGSGKVTIGADGTLDWNIASDLTNTITGSGTLVLSQNRSGNYKYALDSKLSVFTGTVALQGQTRLEWNVSATSINNATIDIRAQSEFWPTVNNTYTTVFNIAGNGNGVFDSSQRGAMRIQANSTFNGSVNLTANALLSMGSASTATFNGAIDTNGYTLDFGQSLTPAGGTFVIQGNVLSTGDTLGTIVNRNENSMSLKIGNASADSSVTQTINAKITNNNTTKGLVFQTGAGTINAAGAISGSAAITKTGTGTLNLQTDNTATGALTVSDGTVNLSNSNSFASLTITKGTVNANRAYADAKGSLPVGCTIIVGSEAGEAAYLKLAGKALGDHGGTVTVYKNGTIEMAGSDTSIGNNKGITFVGGGTISGSGYFWLRGNNDGRQALAVTGANAQVSINANMYMIDNQSTLNVQKTDSTLTLSKNILQWDSANKSSGLTTVGAGTVILKGANTVKNALIIGKLDTDGTTMLNGGTVEIAGGSNAFSSYTINKGVLKVSAGSLGSGAITVNQDGTFLWNKAGEFSNKILGTGQVVWDTASGVTASSANLSEFAGTMELKSNVRLYTSSNIFGTTTGQSTMKINSGTELWTGGNQSFYMNFDLAGTGAGAGGDGIGRGAIRIEGTNSFYGNVVLSSDALIGSANNGVPTGNNGIFYGSVDVQGHNLTVATTVGTTGGVTFAGNITSSVADGGKITVNNGEYYAKFGDTTAAAADSPTTQTIDVPIVNNNSTNSAANGLIFQPGENRTIELKQSLSNYGFFKTGAGNLILSAENTTTGAVTVAQGTLTLKNANALQNTSEVVVNSGAILDLNELKAAGVNANIPSLTIDGGEVSIPVSITDGIVSSEYVIVSGNAAITAGTRFALDSLGESLDWNTVMNQTITLLTSPNEITGFENATVDSSQFLMSDVGERTYFTISMLTSAEGYTLLAKGTVPEPSSWFLLIIAALGLPILIRRKRMSSKIIF